MSTVEQSLYGVCNACHVSTQGWVPYGNNYEDGTDYWQRYDKQQSRHVAVVHEDRTVELYEVLHCRNSTALHYVTKKQGVSA